MLTLAGRTNGHPDITREQDQEVQSILGRLIPFNLSMEAEWKRITSNDKLLRILDSSIEDQVHSPRKRTVSQREDHSCDDDRSIASKRRRRSTTRSEPPLGNTVRYTDHPTEDVQSLTRPSSRQAASRGGQTPQSMSARQITFKACRQAAQAVLEIPFPLPPSNREHFEGYKKWLSTHAIWGKVLLIENSSSQIYKVFFERFEAARAFKDFVVSEAATSIPGFSTAEDSQLRRLTPSCRISSQFTRTLVIDAVSRPNDPVQPTNDFKNQMRQQFPNIRGEFMLVQLWSREERLAFENTEKGKAGVEDRRRIRGNRSRFLVIFNSIAEAIEVKEAMDPLNPHRTIKWPRKSGFTCEHGLDISDVDLNKLDKAGLSLITRDSALFASDYGRVLDDLSARYREQEKGTLSLRGRNT